MHPIVYDVAVSIDGFIAGPDGDISQFPASGQVVDDYFARLAGYQTALMGRATYEFGYGFGLKPGQNPYPNMDSYVFSDSLDLPAQSDVTHLDRITADTAMQIKHSSTGPIYLTGGGVFASVLLKAGLIDQVILKRAPILLGAGTPLFEAVPSPTRLVFKGAKDYGSGYVLQYFDVEPSYAI